MRIDDILLMAYVDGELSPQQREQVEQGIGASPELAERTALLRASRLPYQRAFAHQKLPPVPERLAAKIAPMTREHAANDTLTDNTVSACDGAMPSRSPIRSRLRIAPAWLAVAFVTGAFCWGAAQRFVLPGLASGRLALASTIPGASPWVQAAASYQQLYSHETLEQVEPDLEASARIVDDIRHVDGLDLHIPDLRADGLTFKRVQRLRFHGKPLVQIVYLPRAGAPVALCVMKEAKPDQAMAEQHVNDMNVVTWRHAQLGYALIGKRDGVALPDLSRKISSSVSGQLFGEAAARMLSAVPGVSEPLTRGG